jgi:hypothetical protein
MLLLSALALWAGSAFLVERFVIDVNGQPALPTQSSLHSGAGRVLKTPTAMSGFQESQIEVDNTC